MLLRSHSLDKARNSHCLHTQKKDSIMPVLPILVYNCLLVNQKANCQEYKARLPLESCRTNLQTDQL
jgi:hypothetical protein